MISDGKPIYRKGAKRDGRKAFKVKNHSTPLPPPLRLRGNLFRPLFQRQAKSKERAARRVVRCAERASVFRDDAVREREADAVPF